MTFKNSLFTPKQQTLKTVKLRFGCCFQCQSAIKAFVSNGSFIKDFVASSLALVLLHIKVRDDKRRKKGRNVIVKRFMISRESENLWCHVCNKFSACVVISWQNETKFRVLLLQISDDKQHTDEYSYS